MFAPLNGSLNDVGINVTRHSIVASMMQLQARVLESRFIVFFCSFTIIFMKRRNASPVDEARELKKLTLD